MRRGTVVATGVLLGASVAAFACGPSKLPAPPLTGHPTNALEVVLYPPPPARVEAVPTHPPDDAAVWIDGEWTWQARRWGWKPGRWISPPPGARFAPWTTVRDRAGTLYFAAGAWRDASGLVVAEPSPLAIGQPAPGAIVSPEGAHVQVGPPVPLDAGITGAGSNESDASSPGTRALEELKELESLGDLDGLDGGASQQPYGARLDAGSGR